MLKKNKIQRRPFILHTMNAFLDIEICKPNHSAEDWSETYNKPWMLQKKNLKGLSSIPTNFDRQDYNKNW